MRRSLRAALCFGVVFALVMVGVPAFASSAGADDPRDSAGRLDIKRVSDVGDDQAITFRVETYDPFQLKDIRVMEWEFDFNGDGIPTDGCIFVDRVGSTNFLTAALFGECGQEAWSTTRARIVGGNALEFTVKVLDLVEGGHMRSGRTFGYRVTTTDVNGTKDTAPKHGLVEQGMGSLPTPRPGIEDTLIGNRSSGSADVGRSGTTKTGNVKASGSQASSESAPKPKGLVLSVPIIGNLCSGPWCFALGAGAPLIAALTAWIVVGVVRTRRRRRVWSAGYQEPVPVPEPDPRSHPGNL